MKLLELTKEQVLEIVRLVYPFDKLNLSDLKILYQEFDPSWLEDADEYIQVNFNGITFGNKIDEYRLIINKNLDLYLDVIRRNPDNFTEKDKLNLIQSSKGDYVLLGYFPIRNQHEIHKNFIEWDVAPE